MSSSSTRLERYLTIAACGSGAAGLAVSPLHADIQYFGSEFTLSLPGGSSTWGSTYGTFSGGGVSWSLGGTRSAYISISTQTWSFGESFSSTLRVSGSNFTYWTVWGTQVGTRLFGAGELIDLNTMQSASSWAPVHIASNWFTNYYYFFSSSAGYSMSFSRLSTSSSNYGMLSPGDRGFLALGFDLDGETVYGWADISLSSDGLSLTVHSWAFEDSGEGILAGQTESSGGTPVPGLGGLAALACGAAGLRRKRDRVA